MMYSAIDISKYIIDCCYKNNKPITNLKLQKMLYFIWIDYYKIKKEYLYDDDICAWQLGPVVPSVYYEFCSYAGKPILQEYDINLFNSDTETINKLIEQYIDIPSSKLVNMTHKKGFPWDKTFLEGIGNRSVIKFPLIISLECK